MKYHRPPRFGGVWYNDNVSRLSFGQTLYQSCTRQEDSSPVAKAYLNEGMTMPATLTFAKPPVVELVLGAQFSPITKLTAGHFGLFWKELGPDWVEPSDGPVIGDRFELFDRSRWSSPEGIHLRLEPVRLPGRFLVEHRHKDRLIQLQATRFHLNWRKRDDFYPTYKNLIAEFEATFARFTEFAKGSGLGTLALNQWELTYIDSFPREEYWQTPADWSRFLPGLFGTLFPTDGLDVLLENRAAEWSYEIQPRRGRLHIAAQPGRWGEDKRDSLLLQMTARGPVGRDGTETLRAGLDLGHDVAVGAFLRVVDKAIQQRWGESL